MKLLPSLTFSIALPTALLFVLAPGASEVNAEPGQQSIVGGSESSSYQEVVFLTTPAGACTGTLVGKRLVLTAAHCVVDGGTVSGGAVRFGNRTGAFTDTRQVERNLPHRRYRFGAVTSFDIAFVRLTSDAPEEMTPYQINLERLTESDIGSFLVVVGFGVSNGASQTGAGIKREINLGIDELTAQHIGYGNASMNICQGDSGGPSLRVGGGAPTVFAVSSFGSDQCMARSYVARTDVFPDFVREVVSAWGDGPCASDGTCNDSCTEFVDPDCDPCGLDGTCASGCPLVDLDCPLAGTVGATCEDGDECESRQCIEASDDPRIKYCSTECDPNDPALGCDVPLTCVSGMCRYVEPTPGAQGARCNDNGDCRSAICDIDNAICVEPCSADSDCTDEFSCDDLGGQQVCTVPGSGGGCLGCGVTPSWRGQLGNLALLILLLFGYGAAARRRREPR